MELNRPLRVNLVPFVHSDLQTCIGHSGLALYKCFSSHFVCPWQKMNFDKSVHHKPAWWWPLLSCIIWKILFVVTWWRHKDAIKVSVDYTLGCILKICGKKNTHMFYWSKSINTAVQKYSVRLQSHQNLLAADLRIQPMHLYGNAADFLRNLPFADSYKNVLHSHRNALAESANPQPAEI